MNYFPSSMQYSCLLVLSCWLGFKIKPWDFKFCEKQQTTQQCLKPSAQGLCSCVLGFYCTKRGLATEAWLLKDKVPGGGQLRAS